MKLLFVWQVLEIKDWIADHNQNLLHELVKLPIQISVLHYQDENEILKIKGINYIKFNPFTYKRFIDQFDVFHFQFGSSYFGWYVSLAFLLTPKTKKIISTLHDLSNFTFSKFYRIIKENVALLRSNICSASIYQIIKYSKIAIVYSNFFANSIKENMSVNNIVVIKHWTRVPDHIKVSYSPWDPLRICTFWSITPRKGIEELIYSINNLVKENKEIFLEIYGYIPFRFYEKKLLKLIKQLWLEKHIQIIKNLPKEEIINAMQDHDLIVIPRKHTNEWASWSLSYAIASWVPIATVSIWSFKEYIIEGYNGYIIDHSCKNYTTLFKSIYTNWHNLNNHWSLEEYSRNYIANQTYKLYNE